MVQLLGNTEYRSGSVERRCEVREEPEEGGNPGGLAEV